MRRALLGLGLVIAFTAHAAPALAATDDIYVSEPFASDPDVGAVIKVDTAGTQSLLAQQGNLPTIQVNQIAFEPPDNLLVAIGDGKVVRVNKNTGAQSILSQDPLLNSTFGVAVAPNGEIFVTDSNKVFKIAQSGAATLVEDDPLLGTAKGLTVAPNGDIFVVSTTLPGLVKVSGGVASEFSKDLVAYDNPQAVARDSAGNLYVANRNKRNVLTVGPAGGAPAEFIPATNPIIDEPVAVAVDRLDNVVVADLDVNVDNNPGVVKFSPAKAATIVTTGGQLQDQRGIAVDTTALPVTPTNPDKSVTLSTSVKKSQKALKQKGVIVEVGCGAEACTASATGTLTVGKKTKSSAKKKKKAKPLKLTAAKASIAANQKVKLKLKLSKKVTKAVRRALKAKRKVTARLTVNVKDAAGNAASKKLTVKIRK